MRGESTRCLERTHWWSGRLFNNNHSGLLSVFLSFLVEKKIPKHIIYCHSIYYLAVISPQHSCFTVFCGKCSKKGATVKFSNDIAFFVDNSALVRVSVDRSNYDSPNIVGEIYCIHHCMGERSHAQKTQPTQLCQIAKFSSAHSVCAS